MLIIPPLPARRPRKADPPAPLPPPAALLLASAELTVDPETGEGILRLTFDRAIDVTGLVPSQVTVDDGDGPGWAYAGSAVASLPDPRTVVLALAKTGTAEGPTVLNATAATGIVAEDGGTWAGVVGCVLPYP